MYGLALCAGVGGLELGISAAVPNYRAVCYVERGAYVSSLLAARMEAGDLPPAPIYSDLRSFDGRPWRGVVDLVSAGYPCQPFSVAGSRAGADDPRHLWPEVYRIIREARPRLVFLENVPGHLSMGFGDVLGDLAAAGYAAEWGVFSAAEVGAPHLRKRLFCLAFSDAYSGGRQEQREPKPGGQQGQRGREPHRLRQGREQPHPAKTAGRWGVEPNVGRVVDGAPFRVDRLRALGNAVVPDQAALAFRELLWRAQGRAGKGLAAGIVKDDRDRNGAGVGGSG